MKTKLLKLTAIIIFLVLVSCNKEDHFSDQSFAGTYIGTLTANNLKKASEINTGPVGATSTVDEINNSTIEVHCFNDDLDTTFMLNYFDDYDSVIVCLNDSVFDEIYAQIMGQGGMMNDMMNHQNDETDWQYMMNNFPQAGSLQMGGFDMMNHTFNYQFEMMDGDTPYTMSFQGIKQ